MLYTTQMLSRYQYLFVFGIIAAALGGTGYRIYAQNYATAAMQTRDTNVYAQFDLDVYDIIAKNYWQKPSEADMSTLFLLSLQKAADKPDLKIETPDRAGVEKMLATYMKSAPSDNKRRDVALLTAQVALANLPPNGRSGILSKEDETALRNLEGNINPTRDLYATLGLPKEAATSAVQAAYSAKAAELALATTTEALTQLAQVTHAKDVLVNPASKALYDTTKMEPTVSMREIGNTTLYVDMSQVSPATFGEFVQNLSTNLQKFPSLTHMIIDLRHNMGGDLDFVQYFFALFMGPQQFVFDLYHQGDLQPQRTPGIASIPELAKFREIAVLTDNETKSTAELTAATFKKFRLGTVVGTQSAGWGTVENTFPISTRISSSTIYSILLVHSITLREDNTPIQDHGVNPDIDTSKTPWPSQLPKYFDTDMQSALRQVLIQHK